MYVSVILFNSDSTYTIKSYNPGSMSLIDVTELLDVHFQSILQNSKRKRKQL